MLFSFLFSGTMFIIDSPRSDVISKNNILSSFRLYDGGGVISRVFFGVLNNVNIGVDFDIGKFIGTNSPDLREPSLELKWKIYEGDKFYPEYSIGFSGQGYDYDAVNNKYLTPRKAVFFVAGKEFVKKLYTYIGVNVNDFTSDRLYGFLSGNYEITEKSFIFFEFDSIRFSKEDRINAGFGISPSSNLKIDLVFRTLTQVTGKLERAVLIEYIFGD